MAAGLCSKQQQSEESRLYTQGPYLQPLLPSPGGFDAIDARNAGAGPLATTKQFALGHKLAAHAGPGLLLLTVTPELLC